VIVEFETYDRRTFEIQAIRITNENMQDIAEMCMTGVGCDSSGEVAYVNVPVTIDKRVVRQRARAGDYLTYNGKEFKVYTKKSFAAAFVPRKIDNNY
jgi:hypothetical protein